MGVLEPWLQFGLGGVVIGSLFATLRFFIKEHRRERELEAKRQRELEIERDKRHREERTEWKESLVTVTEQANQTSKEIASDFRSLLTDTIRVLDSQENEQQ